MPFENVTFRPGINAQFTPTLNIGGWSSCNLIRFKDGLPQILGGWMRLTDSQVVGTCRGMHSWEDLNHYAYLALGTDQRLMVYSQTGLNDITPLRATHNVAVAFSTSLGSPSVKVTDAAHGAAVGDWINVVTAVSVGGLVIQGFVRVATVVDANNWTFVWTSNATANVAGGGAVALFSTVNTFPTITVTLANHGYSPTDLYTVHVSTTVATVVINGQYLVQTVVDANNFTVTALTNANATTSGSENGGQVRLQYLLASGLATSVYATGYGSGTYGSGTWGISTTIVGLQPCRQWSLDNWGAYLVANPTDLGIYVWIPDGNFSPATLISQAPTKNHAMFVANPAQIMVSLGAETGGTQDPNLIRWCDVGDYTVWTATQTNQAGSYRIPNGSQIVGGLASSLQAFVWTDVDLWSMQYIGLPFVFSFQQVGNGCGLMSMRSMSIIGNRMIWMSQKGFFELAGKGVAPLRCDVWDIVFQNINTVQSDKIFCAPNSEFNELAFYYCSSGSDEIDSYIKFNIVEEVWDYGTLDRTAWNDVSVFGSPVGVDLNGYIQQHETSNDADGDVLTSFIKSGAVDMAKGQEVIFIDYLVTDAKLSGTGTPTLNLTLAAQEFPNSAEETAGPFPITATSTFAEPRIRGHQFTFEFGSGQLGMFWRVGRARYRFAPDGRNG